MDTQNYKRTLAGSVGAGMGALMGASGRTYFILEHKTSSKYHQAGESQKIIVDQVELIVFKSHFYIPNGDDISNFQYMPLFGDLGGIDISPITGLLPQL